MSTALEIYNEGEKLKDAGDYEAALEKFLEAVQVDEGYALAHFALAVVYGRLGKHAEAVQHGERACELEPNDAFSFTAMSLTYQRAYAGTGNMEFITLAETARDRAHALQAMQ